MYLEQDLHQVYQEYIKKAQAARQYELAQALEVVLGQKTSWVHHLNNTRHQILQILLRSVSKKTKARIKNKIGPFPY